MVTLAITREQIVEEALALLREGGLADVSLRKIGARLGVKAPSLYWHVESKEALHSLMSQAIFRACLNAVPPCASWQEWLREFGLALWRAQRETPDIQQLIVATVPNDAARREAWALIADRLMALGMPSDLAEPAQRSVQALVTGWTTLARRHDTFDPLPNGPFLTSLEALISGWAARV